MADDEVHDFLIQVDTIKEYLIHIASIVAQRVFVTAQRRFVLGTCTKDNVSILFF